MSYRGRSTGCRYYERYLAAIEGEETNEQYFGYLCWRGDLSLSQSVFNEVDNLVLSTLCYLDFEEIVPRKGEGMITIQQAANQYFSIHGLPNCPDEEKATPLNCENGCCI